MNKDDPIGYALRFGGMCRDCADENGTCPSSGLPCDTEVRRKIMAKALEAWKYGIKHNFINNPFE